MYKPRGASHPLSNSRTYNTESLFAKQMDCGALGVIPEEAIDHKEEIKRSIRKIETVLKNNTPKSQTSDNIYSKLFKKW